MKMRFFVLLLIFGFIVSCSSSTNEKFSLADDSNVADTVFISDSIFQIYIYNSSGSLREITWAQKGTDAYEKIVFSESGRLSVVEIINSARWEETKTGIQRMYNLQKIKLDTSGIPTYYMFMKNFTIIDSIELE